MDRPKTDSWDTRKRMLKRYILEEINLFNKIVDDFQRIWDVAVKLEIQRIDELGRKEYDRLQLKDICL